MEKISFNNIKKIDCHLHFNHKRGAMLNQGLIDNFSFLSINTDIPFFQSIQQQEEIILKLKRKYKNQINYLTTFSCVGIESEEWKQKTIDTINRSLDNGAVGVKVWKNIGMELKNHKKGFIMIDDSLFNPIFDYLSSNKIPLLGHLGEPKNCWLPIDRMTVLSDRAYFKEHPEYHMYLHKEYPSYKEQINARDKMLENHPSLKFIGAHLGSTEYSVSEVAKRLDKFPNMMVDLAERICHLQHQSVSNWQEVHDFFIKYKDRIIYGSDVIDDGKMTDEEIKLHIHTIWQRDWEYFTTNNPMESPRVVGAFNGLELPNEVINKIYYYNAHKTYKI